MGNYSRKTIASRDAVTPRTKDWFADAMNHTELAKKGRLKIINTNEKMKAFKEKGRNNSFGAER